MCKNNWAAAVIPAPVTHTNKRIEKKNDFINKWQTAITAVNASYVSMETG